MGYSDKLVFKDRILSKSKINIMKQKGVKIKLALDVKVKALDDINLVDTTVRGSKLYPVVTLYDGVYYILQGEVVPGKEAVLISKVVLKTMLFNPADNRN